MTAGVAFAGAGFNEPAIKTDTFVKPKKVTSSTSTHRGESADSPVHKKALSERKIEKSNIFTRILGSIGNALYVCYRSIQILGHTINIMVRRVSPESIRQAADGLGGVFLKLLQFICSSEAMAERVFGGDYKAYVKELQHVTSSNKPMSLKKLAKCLDTAGVKYHTDMLDCKKNLGTGSIGEVNEIYTTEGQTLDPNLAHKTPKTIVVKVVSPANETKILSDIKLMKLFMDIFSFIKPNSFGPGLKQAMTDFIDSFKDELNLEKEAENTRTQAEIFSKLPKCDKFNISDKDVFPITRLFSPPDLSMLDKLKVKVRFKVPSIDSRHTTRRSMAMQQVDGVTLSASDKNDEKLGYILHKVLKVPISALTKEQVEKLRGCIKLLAFSQWFYCYSRTGFFNADIHDGNIMVAEENGKLCIYFIDLGNAQQHTKAQTVASQKIGIALRELKEPGSLPEGLPPINRNEALNEVVKCLRVLGRYKRGTVNWKVIKQKIDELVPINDKKQPETRVIDIFNMIHDYGVDTPRDIMALFRAMLLIKSNQKLSEKELKELEREIREEMAN